VSHHALRSMILACLDRLVPLFSQEREKEEQIFREDHNSIDNEISSHLFSVLLLPFPSHLSLSNMYFDSVTACTYDIGLKAEGLVLEPLRILQGNAIVLQTVEIFFAKHENPDLETAQDNCVDIENGFPDVITPFWLQVFRSIRMILVAKFRHAFISVNRHVPSLQSFQFFKTIRKTEITLKTD